MALFFYLIGLLVIGAGVFLLNHALSKVRLGPVRVKYDYDIIVVGCSIAGPVMAKALSDQGRQVLVVERSLYTKPDRIVGELLQPGGIDALRSLGMEQCALSVGMPCKGYVVVDRNDDRVHLPYREGVNGVSFHFGDFVQNLRAYVYKHCRENVDMVEGTVLNILTEGTACFERAYGIEYSVAADGETPDRPFTANSSKPNSNGSTIKRIATAPLIIMCDGGMSRWKGRYQHYTPAAEYHSNFVGIILKKVRLPLEQYGTVFFGKTGPILSYRLDDNELRMLVDYNKPTLPSLEMQSEWLVGDVAPCLPEEMREEFIKVAKDTKNLRSMPVARYPPTFPSIKGYIGIGDHGNQRHPLTGGGMTCAFRDAIRLAEYLRPIRTMCSEDPAEMAQIEDCIQAGILRYSRLRYAHSCCINLLSWALYEVFSLSPLRDACFDYFVRGGECVSGPMDLLSGLEPNVATLGWHYYSVMIYGAFSLMTKSGKYSNRHGKKMGTSQMLFNALTFFVDPYRLWTAVYLLVKSSVIMLSLAWNEFYSFWRFIDPTSAIGCASKKVKTVVYAKCRNGRQRKPVGL